MQFQNNPNSVDPLRPNGDPIPAPASQADRLAGRSWKPTVFTTTTVALSMLAFNVAAFLPANAVPAPKAASKAAGAKPAAVKKAAAKKVPAKAAARPAAKVHAASVAEAPKPYLPRHRSIWALRWAQAHPAQEAAYQAQLKRRWEARHHLPITGVAKAMPAAHHEAAITAVHAAAAARAAHPAGWKKSPPAKAASRPAARKPQAKIAKAAPAHPAARIASRPASRASAAKTRLAKTHIVRVAAVPEHVQMRMSAIKSMAAAARVHPPVLAALSKQAAPANGQARQHHAAATSVQSSDTVTLDFVAADINDVLKALAVQTGANIVSSADVKGTVTVSLANVSLEEALDMVARLSGYQYAKVGNTYVVGTASGIQALTGSTGTSEQQVTQVVTFDYANPDDVMAVLKQRFPSIDISKGTSISGSKAGAGAKALILTGDPAFISQAKDLVVQLDQSMGANVADESTVAYHVKYASLPDLISILNNLVPALVVTPGPSQGFTAKAPSAAASASSSSGSGEGTSGSAGASAGASGTPSTGGGATGASQASAIGPSMLLLTGSDADISRAQQILAQVDIQPKQLLFETKVVEMTNDAERQLGLTYDFSGAHTSIGEDLPPGTTSIPTVEPDPYPGQVLKGRTFGRTYITDFVNVQLNALETQGRAHLLADPDISAINGQPAQVFIGDEINYVSSITTSTTGENVTTSTVQVGVIFRVTGKVDNDGYITLNIHPEVSSIEGWVNVPGGGQLPNVATRYADTTIRVKDGDTIAIGGLIQENDIESIQKVPILGDLPFFGQLFRYNDHQKQTDQVVFFLKTSIMKQS